MVSKIFKYIFISLIGVMCLVCIYRIGFNGTQQGFLKPTVEYIQTFPVDEITSSFYNLGQDFKNGFDWSELKTQQWWDATLNAINKIGQIITAGVYTIIIFTYQSFKVSLWVVGYFIYML